MKWEHDADLFFHAVSLQGVSGVHMKKRAAGPLPACVAELLMGFATIGQWPMVANPNQSVEKPGCAIRRQPGFQHIWGKKNRKQEMVRVIPFPSCQFFEVHGSKFKLHPVCHLGQASVLCITHGVFFFRVRKGPFNRFFAFLVKVLVLGRIAGVVRQFLIFFPDMALYRLYTILGMGTELSGRAIGADLWVTLVFPVSIPVGGAVFQDLVFGTDDAVIELIIDIFYHINAKKPSSRWTFSTS